MVQILGGKLIREDTTNKARGGTELIAEEMIKRIDPELLSNFQIIHSRVRDLDNSKKKIFVAHDLPEDPEANFLKEGGYNHFDKLVFVSNWQMQAYIKHFSIPWYKCEVIKNAIIPLEKRQREGIIPSDEPIKLVYHTTPHRGLDILASAFNHIYENVDKNITLDVFSSFSIYGWEERDKEYEELFSFLKNHPAINYHGAVPHEDLVKKLPEYDIFAYPSKWPETSCISLIEAMSAGLACVHSNYAALYETSANWTMMYQYQNSVRDHAGIFTHMLRQTIDLTRSGAMNTRLFNASQYIDTFYSWDVREIEWDMFLRGQL